MSVVRFRAAWAIGAAFLAVVLSVGMSQMAHGASSVANQGLAGRDHYFYAYVQANENLDVLIQKAPSNIGNSPTDSDMIVTVNGPNGEVAGPCTITAASAPGVETCPFPDLSSDIAGIWQVSLEYVNDVSPDFNDDEYIWDIDVQNGTTELPGRVWTERYAMFERSAGPFNFQLWYQHEFGYTYRANYIDYVGIASEFLADPIGIRDTSVVGSECASIYKSSQTSTTATKVPANGACGGSYKIFFEEPDAALPTDAVRWDDTQDWIKRDPNALVPDISNFSFTHNSTTVNSGTFSMDVANFNGNLVLEVDVNNDGDYTDPEDRQIPFGAAAGQGVTVAFDGLDGNNNPIPITQQMMGRVRIERTGEIHLVNGDVESRGGLEVERLNGPGTLAERSTIYWDDTEIPNDNGHCSSGSSTTPVVDGTAGADSTGGVHGWPFCNNGGWGDTRYIDDWAYVLLNEDEVTGPIFGPTPYDYGDAPDSYGTTLGAGGARHAHSFPDSQLRLGATWQDEVDAVAPLDGTSDGADEDGVLGQIVYQEDVATSVDVAVHNVTNEPATLVGWMDLNNNGTFEASERVMVPVSANSGDTTQTVTFPTGNPTGDTFARFRLFPGVVVDPQPTGDAAGGEVEDYAVAAAVLHVGKTVAPGGVVKPGDTVTYTLTISNNGSAPLTNVIVGDDLSDVIDDATYNNDAAVTGAGAGSVTYAAPALAYTAANLPGGAIDTVTYSVTVDNPPQGNKMLTNRATSNTGNCTPDSNDPACQPETPTPMSDVDINKTVSSTTYEAGDMVSYTVTVENTGTGPADVSVVDDLSDVIDDAMYNNDAAVAGAGGTASYAAPNLTYVNSALAPGQTATITYSVTTLDPSNGNKVLRNAVAGSEGDCPVGSTNPDCSKVTTGPDVKTIKTVLTSGDGVADPGDTMEYAFTVVNDGGGIANAVEVTDDLTDVLDDATYNNDVAVTGPAGSTVSYSSPVLTLTIPALGPGESATVTYTVRVNQPATGDSRMINRVVDNQGGTCVSGSTDPACATNTPVTKLVVNKVSASDDDNLIWGDTVTYTMTITNQGQADAQNVIAVDDMSDVIDDATYNNDAVIAGMGQVTYSEPELTYVAATIPAGQTATVTYSVQVNSPNDGNHILKNRIAKAGPDDSDPSDPNGDPPGGECAVDLVDCADERPITYPPNVKVSKTPYPQAAVAGKTVTYTVSYSNLSSPPEIPQVSDAFGVVITETVPNNTTFVASESNPAWSCQDGAPAGTECELAIGDLPAETSGETQFVVRVDDPLPADVQGINNQIKIEHDCTNGCDPLAQQTLPQTTAIARMQMKKTAQTDPVREGDVLTYKVEISNSGTGVYQEYRMEDDFSDVVDDAAYNNDATGPRGSFEFTGSRLIWEGDVLAGETVSLTYSVTVLAYGTGNGNILNSLVDPEVVSNCPAESDDPSCYVSTQVLPTEGMANSGQDWLLVSVLGVGMIGAAALTGLRSLRRTTVVTE